VREIRTLRLTWRGLETWPRWNCEPIPQSKERNWKPSTYSRRACPRPYRRGLRLASAYSPAVCNGGPDKAEPAVRSRVLRRVRSRTRRSVDREHVGRNVSERDK
jgi:hypothetical protein